MISSILLGNYKNVQLVMKYKDDKFILEMTIKGFLGGVKEYEIHDVPKSVRQKAKEQKQQKELDEGLFHYWMNQQ